MRLRAEINAQPAAAPPATLSPMRLRWLLEELVARDGHRLTIGFTCSVALVDEPAEQKLLAEVFGKQSPISNEAVIAHFLPALRSAALQVAQADQAELLLSPDTRPKWIAALRSAANETAFTCGIEILAPFEIEVSSPTLQRERLEQMQRIAAERRSADQVGHFVRAAELLKQWQLLKTTVPSVTPGQLLNQIDPADRGLMLDTLLLTSAGNANGQNQPDLWAVSGPYLVRVDVKQELPKTELIPLTTTIGPLRSVRGCKGKLFIGARSGVMIVDPAKFEPAVVFHHPALVSEHGFTSVSQMGDRLWACHRMGGLVGWRINHPAEPDGIQTPSQLGGEPGNLIDDGLFSVGSSLLKISSNGALQKIWTGDFPINTVLAADNQIIVSCENGTIVTLDRQTLELTSSQTGSAKLTGATLLPWLSATRLLLNRAVGPIECIGLEDQLITQFHAGQTGLRAITACASKIAALSSDRQHILLWNAWDGRNPLSTIYLTGQTHHRITALTFS